MHNKLEGIIKELDPAGVQHRTIGKKPLERHHEYSIILLVRHYHESTLRLSYPYSPEHSSSFQEITRTSLPHSDSSLSQAPLAWYVSHYTTGRPLAATFDTEAPLAQIASARDKSGPVESFAVAFVLSSLDKLCTYLGPLKLEERRLWRLWEM